jgi:hypothetical protein
MAEQELEERLPIIAATDWAQLTSTYINFPLNYNDLDLSLRLIFGDKKTKDWWRKIILTMGKHEDVKLEKHTALYQELSKYTSSTVLDQCT